MTSLSEKLIKKGQTGKVEFLAMKDEIREAIKNGFSRKAIWEVLKDDKKLTIEYRMFLQYCHRYIDDSLVAVDEDAKPQETVVPGTSTGSPQVAPARAPGVVKPKEAVGKGKSEDKPAGFVKPRFNKDVDDNELF